MADNMSGEVRTWLDALRGRRSQRLREMTGYETWRCPGGHVVPFEIEIPFSGDFVVGSTEAARTPGAFTAEKPYTSKLFQPTGKAPPAR